jgi:hypothetical protein
MSLRVSDALVYAGSALIIVGAILQCVGGLMRPPTTAKQDPPADVEPYWDGPDGP